VLEMRVFLWGGFLPLYLIGSVRIGAGFTCILLSRAPILHCLRLTFLGDKITTMGIGDVGFFFFFFPLSTNDYDAATCLKHDLFPVCCGSLKNDCGSFLDRC
jgi:hypothetical protein